jgi:hypothetical protein
VGEVNSTGDVLETALILGRWSYTAVYDDAERILRCHLLPAQLRDVTWIREPDNSKHEDGRRDVAQRRRGAYGFDAPYGHWPVGCKEINFNLDVVGEAIGSLCEAYREVVRTDATGTWVDLLFDHETPWLQVESPYTLPALCVRARKPSVLFVRIPSWVPAGTPRVEGTDRVGRMSSGHLVLFEPLINRWTTLTFPLVERDLVLRHRAHDIRARLRGMRCWRWMASAWNCLSLIPSQARAQTASSTSRGSARRW